MYSIHPVPGKCPVCGELMTLTRLHCQRCDITLEGHFAMSRLTMLAPEQLEFVEAFVRCEGKLKRLGDELGVSYPTVRSRLDDVIIAMGYELPGSDSEDSETLSPEARRKVLDDLAAGRISSEEAVKLLKS